MRLPLFCSIIHKKQGVGHKKLMILMQYIV